MQELSIYAIFKYGLVAFLATLAKTMIEYQDGKVKTWMDVLALMVIGGFGGLMFGLLAFSVLPADAIYMKSMFIGAGSVLGREGLTVLARKILAVARIITIK
jgi:hypothetical protein